jgi:hypothetical protein
MQGRINDDKREYDDDDDNAQGGARICIHTEHAGIAGTH